ncbi:MAG TPA: acyl-CoA dehydrogenase family protein [Candidatus Polarisedimenticolaceae bacterium]|nr:acyl-CoA dehydrogenase family protein [Candidatus Polarisedimenticolaceae bacterium]
MSSSKKLHSESERESLRVAEAARQTEWTEPSFLKEIFLGNLQMHLIRPIPDAMKERPEFTAFYERFKAFLRDRVRPGEIDTTGEYPPEVIDGLRRLGAFGMKIPTEYGGLGLNQVEYGRIMELLGSYDGNLSALLSAHQSIGVPQPVKIFGTPEQKQRFLPRCAAGAISAFALTEEGVGSDPSSLATTAELTPEGDAYILNGTKLWCTNGTIAELLVVMARHPGTKKISAFVVEASSPGITVLHRCRFMGLKALANAVLGFENVRVPKENLIGREGQGLKIALVTLNTGRLALPAGTTGVAKVALETCRVWSGERIQWGQPIGKHEAIAHKIADMAANGFAMESVSDLASRMADRGGYDIRLEAAAAKEWNTVTGWKIVDETIQVRGGRGYETQQSLEARGETAYAVERTMRDYRINLIFEGSSEIMHLFMAREAVDRHLQVAGKMIDPDASFGTKLAALPRIGLFYAWWYPTRWIGWGRWPRYRRFKKLAPHLRFAERATRKLSREIFHGMIVHKAKLQRRQAFLFRTVDVAMEIFAMAACLSRVRTMREEKHPHAAEAAALADLFCRNGKRKIRRLFGELWRNDDLAKYRLGQSVLKGEHVWFEADTLGALPHAVLPGTEKVGATD